MRMDFRAILLFLIFDAGKIAFENIEVLERKFCARVSYRKICILIVEKSSGVNFQDTANMFVLR